MKGRPVGSGFRRRGKALAGASLAAGALTLGAAPAEAGDTLLVTSTASHGKGTFAAAVRKASQRKPLDTIRFRRRLRGVIHLRGDVEVPSGLRIIGNGYGSGYGNGKNEGRVALRGPAEGVDLEFTAGNAWKLDQLYLDRVAVTGHFAAGHLKLTRSTISGDGSAVGTGVVIAPRNRYGESELTISRSTVEGFETGVITIDATADIGRSVIRDNIGGGGVYSAFWSGIDVRASTISGNQLDPEGDFPYGGAGARGGYYAGVDLYNTTVTGNSVVGEGGYGGAVAYNVEVSGSTLTGNSAPTGGGVGAPSDPSNVLGIAGAGDVTLSNSIVSGNSATAPGGEPDCDGHPVFLMSRGGNLFGDPGTCETKPTDLFGLDPKLGPLQDNGGHTPTVALKEGSPAIGLAVEDLATERDQRGVSRDADPDSGAYERR